MAGDVTYTEEQRIAFVERAAQIGLAPAIKELGYPSKHSGHVWMKKYGVEVQLHGLAKYAADLKTFYSAREKLALCQKILDACFDLLVHGEEVMDDDGLPKVYFDPQTGAEIRLSRPTDARSLSSLSATVQRMIQTMELLEGRVTDRTEVLSQDPTDLELRDMINEARARNANQREAITQGGDDGHPA